MPKRIDCNIAPIDSLLEGKWEELTPEQQTDISRRIEESLRRMKAVGAVSADVSIPKESLTRAQQLFAYAMRTANQVNISPHAQRNLGYYMTYLFGLEYNAMGLGESLTAAGGVQQMIQGVRRRGEGSLHEALNRIHFIDNAIEADKGFEAIRVAHGIDRQEFNRLKLDAYEIGFMPYNQRDFGIVGPNGLTYLQGLQKRFHGDLARLGITQAEADTMAGLVTKIADDYNATLEMLHAFGVSVADASQVMNYLPRNFSQETLRRIGWNKKGDSFEVFGFGDQTEKVNITTVFTRSRSAAHYVPEDAVVLDVLLQAAEPKIYELLGVADQGIEALLEDTGTFVRAFVEHIDRQQPELFDALVDAGLVSKLPMTDTQLFQYMKQRYKLPFVDMDEWQAVDFQQIASLYKQQAERLAGRSIMAHFTVKAAVEGGWGITDLQRLSDPATYSKYIQLTSPAMHREDVVIKANEARRLGIEVFENSHIYVHPTVAELFRAQIDVLSDPNQLGIIARLANDLRTTFSQMALASSGFVFRQLYAPIFQTWAGGGRIDVFADTMREAMWQIGTLRASGKSLDDFDQVFDNTVKAYKYVGENGTEQMLTKRELWRMMRIDGEVSELTPFLGETIQTLNYKPTAPNVFNMPGTSPLAGLERQRRYLWDVMMTNELNGGQKAQELYKTANTGWRQWSDQAFHFFAATNMLFDNMGRFALLQSLTDTRTSNRFVRGLQGNFQGVMDYREAMRRVNQYFFRYDNKAKVDEWMRHIRPFWMFQSRNMHSIFRMMVREPGRFMAYQRLWAALNEPEQEEDPIPYGAVPDWINDTAPFFWVIRDDAGNPTGYFTLPRAQIDNIASGTEDVSNLMDGFINFFGLWPQSRSKGISNRYTDLPWDKTLVNRGIQRWAGDSYGHIQALFSTITGVDPRTGAQMRADETGIREDNLWGVRVTPMTKLLLEQLFPIARSVNRSNPGGVFGTPPRFEGDQMVDPGRPSWAGVERRPNSADYREWWQRAASMAGFNLYQFDTLEQLGFRQGEVSFAIREGYRALGAKRRQILQMDPEREQQRIQAEIERLRAMEALQAAMIIDYQSITNWAAERNLDYPAAIRHLRRNDMTAQQLDSLTPEEERELLQRVYGENLLGPLTTPEYNP